jgi:glycosyltransferase involved in cell wall biosynthesis
MHTDKPRVLHVIARFNIGGTARYLIQLLPNLEAKQIDSLLAVGTVQAGEIEDTFLTKLNFKRIESLGRKLSIRKDLKAYLELRKIVKEFKPNIIHSHTFKAGLLCRLMFFKIPKIHTFHGHLLTDPEFSKFQLKAIIRIERFLARRTHKLIVTGNQVGFDLLERDVGKKNQYISIPGVSYALNCLSREIARSKLHLGDSFTILWVARVVPVKNPKLLVEVAINMPECVFLMAGDGSEMQLIREMAPPNLKILGFTDVREVLKAGDLFLSTSLNEGIPFSILEAQEAGLPIVAVKAGALTEIVKDGVDGYLVEASAAEIVKIIDKLRSDRKMLTKLGSNQKSKHDENGYTDFISIHSGLYEETLSGH